MQFAQRNLVKRVSFFIICTLCLMIVANIMIIENKQKIMKI